VGTHFLLLPDQAGEEKSILHSPRHLITHIQAGNYPPAFLLEEEGIIHFLGREQGHILYDWWVSLGPIIMIILVVFAVNIIGKGVLGNIDPLKK